MTRVYRRPSAPSYTSFASSLSRSHKCFVFYAFYVRSAGEQEGGPKHGRRGGKRGGRGKKRPDDDDDTSDEDSSEGDDDDDCVSFLQVKPDDETREGIIHPAKKCIVNKLYIEVTFHSCSSAFFWLRPIPLFHSAVSLTHT